MAEGSVESPLTDGVARATPRQTRGFLFADIRGYTEFVERQGATAAADLLLRYRAIVREAIARNEGAEIRTEGDSFYVVLPSASDAVLCGLAIVQGVAAENGRNPGTPIKVGVGVHAGEAIDTAEGLVGSAVNVAARVCALAGPGEVLVTDTVRGLARSVIPVTFTSRGDQRLKGLAEPIELFRVTDKVQQRSSARTLRKWLVPAALVGVIVLVAIGVYWATLGTPTTSSVPSATPALAVDQQSPTAAASTTTPPGGSLPPSPSELGLQILKWRDSGQSPEHLHGGTYQFDAFRPVVTFAIDPNQTQGDDWWLTCDSPDEANVSAWDGGKPFPGIGENQVIPASALCWNKGQGKPQLDFVRTSTVGGGCTPAQVMSTGQDIIKWLSGISVLDVSAPEPVTVAGRVGLKVELDLSGDLAAFCKQPFNPGAGLVLLHTDKKDLAMFPEVHTRLMLIDVGETRPLIIRVQAPAAADFWTTAVSRVKPLLDSMTISP